MFRYDPLRALTSIPAPIAALVASTSSGDRREAALAAVSAARVKAGRDPIDTRSFPGTGHNLMRYRPDDVSAAILALGDPAR